MRLDLSLHRKLIQIRPHTGKASKLSVATLYFCITDSYSLALGNLKAIKASLLAEPTPQ